MVKCTSYQFHKLLTEGDHDRECAIALTSKDVSGFVEYDPYSCDCKETPSFLVEVILFRKSGKYYTTEEWYLPDLVPNPVSGKMVPPVSPHDVRHSPDFRRIDGGAVLVPSQEPWGYPALIV